MSSTVTQPVQASTSAPVATQAPAVHLTGAAAAPPVSPAAERAIPPFKYADLLDHGPFGDFRDDLNEHGFVVVKNVMTEARAAELRGAAFGWLESFGRGFDRDDPATFGQEFLPQYNRGGMYPAYGAAHEQWTWDCRTEPGVKAAFAKLWGTDKLVSSFDTVAIMMPFQPQMSEEDSSWPHIDLCPSRVGFHCAQGIVNLNHNGPDDGGLVVMKGSSKLMKQFFDEHGRPPVPLTGKIDWYMFSEEDKKWFFDRGCEWHKVCAGPGDLILWRSDTMHQGMPPSPDGKVARVIAYVCMSPAEVLDDEDRRVRLDCWEKRERTSHAPHQGAFNASRTAIRPETGEIDPDTYARKNPVKVTDEVLRLAGVLAYE